MKPDPFRSSKRSKEEKGTLKSLRAMKINRRLCKTKTVKVSFVEDANMMQDMLQSNSIAVQQVNRINNRKKQTPVILQKNKCGLSERMLLHPRNGVPYLFGQEEQLELDYTFIDDFCGRKLNEITDLNEGEVNLMKLWNRFIYDQHGRSMLHLPSILHKFILDKGQLIARKKLLRNFILLLNSFTDAGIIDNLTCFNLIIELQKNIAEYTSHNDEGSRQRVRLSRPRINSNHGGSHSAESPIRSSILSQQAQPVPCVHQHRRSSFVKRGLRKKEESMTRYQDRAEPVSEKADFSSPYKKEILSDDSISESDFDSGRDSRTEIRNILDSFNCTGNFESCILSSSPESHSEDDTPCSSKYKIMEYETATRGEDVRYLVLSKSKPNQATSSNVEDRVIGIDSSSKDTSRPETGERCIEVRLDNISKDNCCFM